MTMMDEVQTSKREPSRTAFATPSGTRIERGNLAAAAPGSLTDLAKIGFPVLVAHRARCNPQGTVVERADQRELVTGDEVDRPAEHWQYHPETGFTLKPGKCLIEALTLATQVGLEGLSMGALADSTGISKSGVFAHFGSREELQSARSAGGSVRPHPEQQNRVSKRISKERSSKLPDELLGACSH